MTQPDPNRLPIPPLPDILLEPIVRLALAEDLGRAGDITTDAVVAGDKRITALLSARKGGVAAGYDVARLALRLIDPDAIWTTLTAEGDAFAGRTNLAHIEGSARSILVAERTMLNFMGRLSGTASLTRRFVDAVAGTNARIVCTRKTTPGLRALEKRAVRLGGAVNHRLGLDDAILIKDNHIVAAGGVGIALARARAAVGHLRAIEIEVETLDQLDEALAGRPDVIMLDNMPLDRMREAVARAAGRCKLEASGGVTLETVRGIAETGVDFISSGALTHSAPALDVGLDFQ